MHRLPGVRLELRRERRARRLLPRRLRLDGVAVTVERVHFSTEPIIDVLSVAPDRGSFPSKPSGLWYSVGDEWEKWCESEGFRDCFTQHRYVLDVDLSRVLRLDSAAAIRSFSRAHALAGAARHGIDWTAVADRGWAGIEIAPYQWSMRHSAEAAWYYSWDVASGCIWNAEAVLSIRHDRPPVPVTQTGARP